MATPARSKLLQHLQRMALLQDGAGLTDAQLLERFVAEKDEDVFAALVRRHGSMVFEVCRRILPGWHDAEDAFQAVFLVLARKAATIQPREKVGNWLYGVAYRTALEARTLLAKRRAKEGLLRDVAAPEPEDESRRELQILLDREVNRLPDRYRMPIVLCDLEGMTRKEAARQLGWPEGTVATRLAKARGILRGRLTRQGLTLAGLAWSSLWFRNGASACVPKALEVSTIKAATVYAANTSMATGLMSANVAVLTQGVLKGMFLSKIKIVTAVLVVLGAIGFGAGAGTYRSQVRAAEAASTVSAERQGSLAEALQPRPVSGEADQVRSVKEIEERRKAKDADEDGREDKKEVRKQKRRHEDDEDEDNEREGKKVGKNKRGQKAEEDEDEDDRREGKKKAGKSKREQEEDEDDDRGRENKKKAGKNKREREEEDDRGRESKKKASKNKREHEEDEDDGRGRENKKKAGKSKREHEEDEDDDRGRENKKKAGKNKLDREDDEDDRGREGKKKAGKSKREREEDEDDDRGREGKKKAGKNKREWEGGNEKDGREANNKSDRKNRRHKDE